MIQVFKIPDGGSKRKMIYEPREDSYMVKDYVEGLDLNGVKALEIGTGSGIIAEAMYNKGANVTASDINSDALKNLPEDVETVRSNLFENIDGKYDLIVFNPPYLPGDSDETSIEGSETWFGGENGVEVTERFLDECSKFLNLEGKAFVILSSLASIDDLVKNYGLEIVEEKDLWFETLYLARYSVE